MRERNEAEQHRFVQSLNLKIPKARFDYTDNVFSMRGDWKTRRGVMKIFFPWRFSIEECDDIEELINNYIERKVR